jgi:hypothetical protein
LRSRRHGIKHGANDYGKRVIFADDRAFGYASQRKADFTLKGSSERDEHG